MPNLCDRADKYEAGQYYFSWPGRVLADTPFVSVLWIFSPTLERPAERDFYPCAVFPSVGVSLFCFFLGVFFTSPAPINSQLDGIPLPGIKALPAGWRPAQA